MMRCTQCGGTAKTTRDVHQYSECGLDYVILENVEVVACRHCGVRGVVLEAMNELHRVLARIIARSPWRLTGREIRLLRTYLGFSGGSFAQSVAARPETVSRWENDRAPMNPVAERLLRLMVFNLPPVEAFPFCELAMLRRSPPATRAPIRIRNVGGLWKQELKVRAAG